MHLSFKKPNTSVETSTEFLEPPSGIQAAPNPRISDNQLIPDLIWRGILQPSKKQPADPGILDLSITHDTRKGAKSKTPL